MFFVPFIILCDLLCDLATSSMVSTDPFDNDRELYIQPFWKDEIDISIGLHPSSKTQYWSLKDDAVAFWFDKMAAIQNGSEMLAEAYCSQQNNNVEYTIVIVIYDLPNRDCAAAASHGEIDCEDSDCEDGLSIYKNDYIDPIYDLLSEYPEFNYIAIIEPDSLPNLVTNTAVAKCAEAYTAYVTGIAYAIEKLSMLDNIALYIDAAHGGWLGWDSNQDGFAQVMNQVFAKATSSIKSSYSTVRIDGEDVSVSSGSFEASKLVRGYSSNVSGYQALGCLNSCDSVDPCGLASQFNDAVNEVLYASVMSGTLVSKTNHTTIHGWIIDTSRNGNDNSRTDCGNWCNMEDAGIGERPTVDDSEIESITEYSSLIDGLLWIKIPGESDGTSDTTADRYDPSCNSADSLDDAPEAGEWFDQFFVNLVTNSDPVVETVSVDTTTEIPSGIDCNGSRWNGGGGGHLYTTTANTINTANTDAGPTAVGTTSANTANTIDTTNSNSQKTTINVLNFTGCITGATTDGCSNSGNENKSGNSNGDGDSITIAIIIVVVVFVLVCVMIIAMIGYTKYNNKGSQTKTATERQHADTIDGLTPPQPAAQTNIVAATDTHV